MSGQTVTTSAHGDAVSRHLAATADEINRTAANIYSIEGVSEPGPCTVRSVVASSRTTTTPEQLVKLVNQLDEAKRSADDSARRAEAARDASKRSEEAILKAVEDRTVNLVAGAVPAPAVAPPPVNGCGGYFVNFEADVALIEYPMINLILSVLPRDQLKDFADDLEKGNLLGGGFGLLKVIFVGVKGLHVAAGSYRTGQEAVVANGADCSSLAEGRSFEERTSTVKLAVACLGLDARSLFGPHPQERKGSHLPKFISKSTFDALMFVARTSCVRLPIGSGDNSIADVVKFRGERRDLCARLFFKPERRKDSID